MTSRLLLHSKSHETSPRPWTCPPRFGRGNVATSSAAALCSHVKNKQRVDLLVPVTDEYENIPCNRESHSSLLARHKEEVNLDVKVVIVCIGRGNRAFRQNMNPKTRRLLTIEL